MNYSTLNNVYDNGCLMLGNVQKLIDRIEYERVKDIDMCGCDIFDVEELLKDLEDLKNIDCNTIVCINYDSGSGYSLDYWTSKDVVI